MFTRSIALALFAAVTVSAATVNRAEAVVVGPATIDSAAMTNDAIQTIRWVCGAYRCDWVPLAVFHPRPSYTLNWDVPRTPGCWREKNRRGYWREVCPR